MSHNQSKIPIPKPSKALAPTGPTKLTTLVAAAEAQPKVAKQWRFKAPIVDACDRNITCGLPVHAHIVPKGEGDGGKKPPLSGAAKRMAEKNPMPLLLYMGCKKPASECGEHFHPPRKDAKKEPKGSGQEEDFHLEARDNLRAEDDAQDDGQQIALHPLDEEKADPKPVLAAQPEKVVAPAPPAQPKKKDAPKAQPKKAQPLAVAEEKKVVAPPAPTLQPEKEVVAPKAEPEIPQPPAVAEEKPVVVLVAPSPQPEKEVVAQAAPEKPEPPVDEVVAQEKPAPLAKLPLLAPNLVDLGKALALLQQLHQENRRVLGEANRVVEEKKDAPEAAPGVNLQLPPGGDGIVAAPAQPVGAALNPGGGGVGAVFIGPLNQVQDNPYVIVTLFSGNLGVPKADYKGVFNSIGSWMYDNILAPRSLVSESRAKVDVRTLPEHGSYWTQLTERNASERRILMGTVSVCVQFDKFEATTLGSFFTHHRNGEIHRDVALRVLSNKDLIGRILVDSTGKIHLSAYSRVARLIADEYTTLGKSTDLISIHNTQQYCNNIVNMMGCYQMMAMAPASRPENFRTGSTPIAPPLLR